MNKKLLLVTLSVFSLAVAACNKTEPVSSAASSSAAQTSIPEHEHKAGTPVKENEVKATCTQPGSYDWVLYCVEDDHSEIYREHRTVDPTGHDYEVKSTTEPLHGKDGTTTYVCKNCGDTYTEKNNDALDYFAKDIDVYRENGKVDKKLSLRFYDDTPNVPYIEVGLYFKEFFKNDLKVTKNACLYKYTNSEGKYLSFDAHENLFGSNGVYSFNHHPDFISSNGKTFAIDLSQEETTGSARTINMSNYNISFHDDGEKAYAPISFLSCLAGGFSGYNVNYNGKAIYVFDRNDQLGLGVRDDNYYENYNEVINNVNTPRPEDLAKYTYGELCFLFDNLRGYTSQLLLGDNNLVSLGLNGTIEKYYPKMKELLLSSNKMEYYMAITSLFAGLWDGGHTACACSASAYVDAVGRIKTEVPELLPLNQQMALKYINKNGIQASFTSAKTQWLGITSAEYKAQPNYYRYFEDSKTAYIGFDHFTIDYNAWNEFYTNNGPMPGDDDSYAFIRSKFYQAVEDGAKNVVLDITTNGGGNSLALLGIVGLLNKGKAEFAMNDTFNKFRSTEKVGIDINLDGKFDEKDELETKKFDFNFGILTSSYSFSCGNLLPSLLKELGYKVLGDRSGGGSCAISYEATGDGVTYVHSSYHCLSNASGQNIDSGVPVDFAIEKTPLGTYTFDVSGFFNDDVVGAYLATAYAKN